MEQSLEMDTGLKKYYMSLNIDEKVFLIIVRALKTA